MALVDFAAIAAGSQKSPLLQLRELKCVYDSLPRIQFGATATKMVFRLMSTRRTPGRKRSHGIHEEYLHSVSFVSVKCAVVREGIVRS